MTSVPNFGSRRLYQRRIGSRQLVVEHLLRLQELAEAADQRFGEFVEGPPRDVAYAAEVVADIRRTLARARPYSQKQGLLDLAARLEREAVGDFRLAIAAGVRAYADTRTGPRGNPNKVRGAATNRARQFVNAALGQLANEHMRGQRGFGWLLEPGRPGQPSAGHAKLVRRAHELATAADVRISEAELSRQVSEARRSALALRYGLVEWTLTVRPRLRAGVSRRC